MTDAIETTKTKPAGLINTATNILLSPGEAFTELQQRPSKLFPLALIIPSTMAVMFWYFSIVDFDWFIDATLAEANLDGEQLEVARESMASMSQTTFKMFGVLGSAIGTLAIYVLQSGYLSLISAITGSVTCADGIVLSLRRRTSLPAQWQAGIRKWLISIHHQTHGAPSPREATFSKAASLRFWLAEVSCCWSLMPTKYARSKGFARISTPVLPKAH